jgi:hypothetical protein
LFKIEEIKLESEVIMIIKKQKKLIIVLIIALALLSLSLLPNNGFACNNGPNYWGNSWPGSPHPYEHPEEPSKYIFGSVTPLDASGYDGSHYGTHDWIADAAIRSLRNLIKNPLGSSDWAWLMNHFCANKRLPYWRTEYGNLNGHHDVVRSYITYLFATQMPDMRIRPEMSELRKSHYPQKITILREGVVIEDFKPKFKNANKWVGQIQQHVFHFKVEDLGNINAFLPSRTKCVDKVRQLSEAAILCIGNTVKDEQEVTNSAMQPEGAAGWLGAMTHYFADLVVPAHLLEHKLYPNVYYKDYHNWFENQLASLTKWDKVNKGGPETIYFSWDIAKIGMTGLIVPMPPELAVLSMANHAIELAYGADGIHQHKIFTGNNHDEARNSGLYLDNEEKIWDWKKDIDTYGRTGSNHRYFYDKVEELLCWAVFFSACVMQYCLNEGKKKVGKAEGLDPGYYVNRDPNEIPSQPPDPDPQRYLDEFFNSEFTDSLRDKFKKLLKNLGMLVAPIIMAVTSLMGRTFHLISR